MYGHRPEDRVKAAQSDERREFDSQYVSMVEKPVEAGFSATVKDERRNTFVRVKGEPDDISVWNPTLFRMEQMDDGVWWLAVYQGDDRISMFLHSKKRITCNVNENDLEWEYTDHE